MWLQGCFGCDWCCGSSGANLVAAGDLDALCGGGEGGNPLGALGEDQGEVGPHLLDLRLAELREELVGHAVEQLLHVDFVGGEALNKNNEGIAAANARRTGGPV